MAPIVIDYTPAFEQSAGIGRYVRELVTALSRQQLDHKLGLFIAGARRSELPPPPSEWFICRSTRISPKWFARIWHRARLPIPIELFTGVVDLFHATDFVLPPHLPTTRTLLTVHDLSFLQIPEAASPGLRTYLERVVPHSVKRATHILADSTATKLDLMKFYGTEEEKITVLLSGVDSRFRRTTHNDTEIRHKYKIGDEPYIFSVGTVQPRKNYIRLVHALERIRESGHDVSLVIAGGQGWLSDPLHRAIDRSAAKDYIHLVGFADEIDLPALYSNALCLAFPSLYEGFGFPVLEAMACGTPVLTSSVSSLPEVAGEAALMVDPLNQDEITDGLTRIITDESLCEELTKRGYSQAARFTWDRSAAQLLTVYNRLLDAI